MLPNFGFPSSQNHAHGEVELCRENLNAIGKHPQCCRKIIVLKRKFRDEFVKFREKIQNDDNAKKRNAMPEMQSTNNPGSELNNQKEKCRVPLSESVGVGDCCGSIQKDSNTTSTSKRPIIEAETSSTSHEVKPSLMQQSSLLQEKASAVSSSKSRRETCVICNTVRKNVGNQKACASVTKCVESIQKLRQAATTLNDTALLSKLENSVKVPYHPTCLLIYKRKSIKIANEQPGSGPWHSSRQLHKEAFDSLSVTIRREIIENGKVLYLSELFEWYRALLQEFQGKKLPNENLSLGDVPKGECNIPKELLSFVSKIVQGPDSRRQDSEDDLPKLMLLCFNSQTFIDDSQRQVVYYLPPLNSSPTSNAMVHETMDRAKDIAAQCNQEVIIVTYDLGVAKIAMQIQKAAVLAFYCLFINLGSLNHFLAYFKALGKFIESAGLIEVVVQA
ncbi:uncharacterized protein LOC117181170 [Belonocnema kinseyi]|uniref:uncharacterized protein LOC117181170 n=1 Tax=Belonocnema kinseyi TaxID=2817044 RepID=UPI00143D0BB2|nr:uncharacterized protein LOC117181170 [Belonocnema kinseyi]